MKYTDDELKQAFEEHFELKLNKRLFKKGSMSGYIRISTKKYKNQIPQEFDWEKLTKIRDLNPGTELFPTYIDLYQINIYVGLENIWNNNILVDFKFDK